MSACSILHLHLPISNKGKPQQDHTIWFGILQGLQTYAVARNQFLDLPENSSCCNFLPCTEQLCRAKVISLTFHSQIKNTLPSVLLTFLLVILCITVEGTGNKVHASCKSQRSYHRDAHSCTANFHTTGLHKCR